MTPTLTIHRADRMTSVSAEEWAALFPIHPDPYQLVRLLDDCGMDGFRFGSLVVRDAGRPILLVPLFFTVMDLAAMADGMIATAGRIAATVFRALLRPRVLGVGFVEGEWGEIGVVSDLPEEVRQAAADLTTAELQKLLQREADLLLLLNFRPDGVDSLGSAFINRLTKVETIPCARVPLPFADVESYLQQLSKNARKDIRRKMRTADGVRAVPVSSPSNEQIEQIYGLYRDTVARADLSLGIHRRSYFERVCGEVPGARYVLYYAGEQMIAFNLLIESAGVLVDKYFGMDLEGGRRLNLYFVSWMANIESCIAGGIPIYHAGPGAEATKARLGARFVPSVTLFRHRGCLANAVLRKARGLMAYSPAIDPTSDAYSEAAAENAEASR